MFHPEKPYNALPLLPPKEAFETPEILKKAIEAHRQLAELKGMRPLLPNQAILIQAIALQEARASSEIENIVTTNDELYRSYANEGVVEDAQTKEILQYNDALWYGFQQLKEKNRTLGLTLFEEICQIIIGNSSGVRKLPGTVLKNPQQNRVIYTPPDGERIIRCKMENLSKFIYEDKSYDPLIMLALVHYQFEAIHPFQDGNGRTGRILNLLFLLEKDLLDLPILYLSKYIIENKASYYKGLQGVTQQRAWMDWILFILEAVEKTAKITRDKILAILDLKRRVGEEIKEKLPRIYSRDLVDVLFEHPYCKIKFLAHLFHRQTASYHLQELEEIGILRCVKKGKEKYFIHDAFLDILMSGDTIQ